MKHFAALASLTLALALLPGLTSCGAEKAPVPEVSPTPQITNCGVDSIAMVTFSATVSDESFNQGTWEAIHDFARANGLRADYYQPASNTDVSRIRSISMAIKEGADVIVAPGVTFASLMETLPREYPEVMFIAIDVDPSLDMEGRELADNLYCVTFAEEQSGYLAGYAAVKDGYTSLGFLGGESIPSVVRYGQGYIQGIDAAAQELRCPVEVKYTYSGRFSGSTEVSLHMADWYRSGTQVIFSCGGAIWTSPVQAAMYYNGMVIGVDSDQHHLGKDIDKYAYNPFISSATKNMSGATVEALELACSGRFGQIGGTWDILGLEQGDYLGLPTQGGAWGFRNFSVPAYERVRDKIASGEIQVDNTCDPDFRFQTSQYTTVDYDA